VWFLLFWLPWVAIVVIALLVYRWKQSTHARADPALARGRWVLITGAASGIGLATAKELLKLGANVFVCDINVKLLDEVFAGFGDDRVVKIKCDVTQQADVDEMARRVTASKHPLDAVINSAGVASPPGEKRPVVRGAVELDVDRDIIPVYAINVFGLARVTSALFPLLLESKGQIVNLASVAGRIAAPGFAVYAGTKHAVVAYTASMRRELAPYGMRVWSIEPGMTTTPLTSSFDSGGPDLSVTQLKKTFGKMEAGGLSRLVGKMQGVDKVSTAIAACLFSADQMPPHIVIDERQFWLYVIGSMIPHTWVDWIVAHMYA
jgi:NAD(P)-dependent dehydrogenase (short-subunit alcohol dehydrogenase family)